MKRKLRQLTLFLIGALIVAAMPVAAVSQESDRPEEYDPPSPTSDDATADEGGDDASADSLAVDDFVRVQNPSGSGDAEIRLDGSAGDGSTQWDLENDATAGNQLQFLHGFGTPQMTLTPSGFLGLGTTSPQDHFHIANTGNDHILLEDTDGASFNIEAGGDFFDIDSTDFPLNNFRIHKDAPSNGLVVRDGIGVGTSDPQRSLHINWPDPAVRLADGAQTWDIESLDGLSVTDVTANTKPLTVETGAPDDALVVDESGHLGVGTNNPGNPLTVDARNDAAGKEQVLQLLNNGPPGFELNNTTAGEAWRYAMDVKNRFVITRAGSGGPSVLIGKQGEVFMGRPFKFFLRPNGNLEIKGTLTEGSDRAAKTDIAPVDPSGLLTTLRNLPISTWFYAKAPGEAHLGPMAQDFFELFGLGSDPTSISPRDMAGVALATIQALDADVQAKDEQIADQQRQIDDLAERLERLEAQAAE